MINQTGRGRRPSPPTEPPKKPTPKGMPKKQGFKEPTEDVGKASNTYGPNPKHFRKGKGK